MSLELITLEQAEPYLTGQITEAELCGVPELDKHIRFKTNLTIIGGCANTGKTHGWLWVMFEWAMRLDKRFLLFCNENDNVELKVMLIEWYCKEAIHRLDRDAIIKAWKWVELHFQFMKQNYKTNLEEVFYLVHAIKRNEFDFDGFFLDPYNSLQTSHYSEHYENAGKMRGFVKKQNAKLMVSMHVLSEAQRTRDKDGNIKCPHVSQLENGSMWFNRSDDAITIHRQTQHEERWKITEIHVQKIKHTRSGGRPTINDKPIELEYQPKFGGFKWVTDKERETGF